MKTNGSRYVLLAFACFIAFILYFVIKVQTDSAYDHELMLEDYYRQEKKINKQYDAETAVTEDLKPQISQTTTTVEIRFQNQAETLIGTALFLRPSSQKSDFEVPFRIHPKQVLSIPKNKLEKGLWYVTFEWRENGKDLRFKQNLYVE